MSYVQYSSVNANVRNVANIFKLLISHVVLLIHLQYLLQSIVCYSFVCGSCLHLWSLTIVTSASMARAFWCEHPVCQIFIWLKTMLVDGRGDVQCNGASDPRSGRIIPYIRVYIVFTMSVTGSCGRIRTGSGLSRTRVLLNGRLCLDTFSAVLNNISVCLTSLCALSFSLSDLVLSKRVFEFTKLISSSGNKLWSTWEFSILSK
jgi:hypothetical protein